MIKSDNPAKQIGSTEGYGEALWPGFLDSVQARLLVDPKFAAEFARIFTGVYAGALTGDSQRVNALETIPETAPMCIEPTGENCQ